MIFLQFLFTLTVIATSKELVNRI